MSLHTPNYKTKRHFVAENTFRVLPKCIPCFYCSSVGHPCELSVHLQLIQM